MSRAAWAPVFAAEKESRFRRWFARRERARADAYITAAMGGDVKTDYPDILPETAVWLALPLAVLLAVVRKLDFVAGHVRH